jgi:hypothetical protein
VTVRSIAEQVNINRVTGMKILTEDNDMRKVCVNMVPTELTEEQKQRKPTIYPDIVGRVISGDETWVYQYEREIK